MGMPKAIGILTLGLGATISLALSPKDPGTSPETLPATSSETKNNSVPSIPSANRISDWKPLDTRRVLVSLDSSERYLLTLRNVCPGLNYARSVGVTMSNNTIWAGFDAITTDSTVCEIERIDQLERS